jgi:hypothetical protein
MGKVYEGIDEKLAAWIRRQHVFFVGTAPSEGGHVNVSPKGPIDSLRILDEHTVEYDDLIGSHAETTAHLRDDGRICVMLCAFDGPPRVVRLHGHGEVVRSEELADGRRGTIRVAVDRVSDSCGWGAPLMAYEGERPQRARWLAQKTPADLRAYLRTKNGTSIDGLPAVDEPVPLAD